MKKISVSLGMLARKYKNVTVEVPDDFDQWDESDRDEMLSNIYSEDDGSSGWQDDVEWGCEEGTHSVISPVSKKFKAEFVVDEFKQARAK